MSQYSMNCDYDSTYHSHHHGSSVGGIDTRRSCSNICHRWESLVPFEVAMDRLYTTLGESVDFFKEIDDSFEEETKTVRTYATDAVMEELWKCKMAATEAGSAEAQDKNSHSRHWSNIRGPSLKRNRDVAGKPDHRIQPTTPARTGFNGYLQRIDHDLLDAIYCRWPSEKPESHETSVFCMDIDSLQRLRNKIWVQDQVLRQITNKVYRTQPCLKEVIKECDLLLVYMEKTKELWQIQKEKNTEPVFPRF